MYQVNKERVTDQWNFTTNGKPKRIGYASWQQKRWSCKICKQSHSLQKYRCWCQSKC